MSDRTPRALDPIIPSAITPGTPVLYVDDEYRIYRTATRSDCFRLYDGTVVVQLEGRTGSFLASRCFYAEGYERG